MVRGDGFVYGYHPRTGEPLLTVETFAAAVDDREARRVALDEVEGLRVSTVHLVIDHGFGDGAPVLWETMVFPADDDETPKTPEWTDYQWRYRSLDDARAGHAEIVAAILAGLAP